MEDYEAKYKELLKEVEKLSIFVDDVSQVNENGIVILIKYKLQTIINQ